jgi:hypothetical protein
MTILILKYENEDTWNNTARKFVVLTFGEEQEQQFDLVDSLDVF